MAVDLATIKREFVRNPAKTGVLGVLFAVMAFFGVRAFVQMRPRVAAANSTITSTVEAVGAYVVSDSANFTDAVDDPVQKLSESRTLWATLREKRGATPMQAFTFNGDCYPQEVIHLPEIETPSVTKPAAAAPVAQADRAAIASARDEAIRTLGAAIVVKSIVFVGGKPMAMIDDRILSVGDSVDGFEITAIHFHDVDLRKGGVTVSVKLFTDRPR